MKKMMSVSNIIMGSFVVGLLTFIIFHNFVGSLFAAGTFVMVLHSYFYNRPKKIDELIKPAAKTVEKKEYSVYEHYKDEKCTTPDLYLYPHGDNIVKYNPEIVARVPPVTETAKYALLGAAYQHQSDDLYVKFDARSGEYYLYKSTKFADMMGWATQ